MAGRKENPAFYESQTIIKIKFASFLLRSDWNANRGKLNYFKSGVFIKKEQTCHFLVSEGLMSENVFRGSHLRFGQPEAVQCMSTLLYCWSCWHTWCQTVISSLFQKASARHQEQAPVSWPAVIFS